MRELDAELLGTYPRRDETVAEEILADDFVYLSEGGDEGGRASKLEAIGGADALEALDADEVEVQLYGEAAAVTSLVTLRTEGGGSSQGVPMRWFPRPRAPVYLRGS